MHMQWYGFSPDSIRQIKAGLGKRGLKLCRAYRGIGQRRGHQFRPAVPAGLAALLNGPLLPRSCSPAPFAKARCLSLPFRQR